MFRPALPCKPVNPCHGKQPHVGFVDYRAFPLYEGLIIGPCSAHNRFSRGSYLKGKGEPRETLVRMPAGRLPQSDMLNNVQTACGLQLHELFSAYKCDVE